MSREPPRTRHFLGAIFTLALLIRLLTAWPLRQPGYTDAYYYAVGAQQLYAGQGFTEPFIWNYLDPPASVPMPGYRYWMPLAAILGWLGMIAFGGSFRAMQAPFIVISALLPLVAYSIAWDLTGKRKYALLAGFLAVFPGFYAHVFVLPDTFAPFALAGSVSLWAAGRGLQDRRPLWFGLAGLAAGLGHLTRADGVLLAGVALLAAVIVPGSSAIAHKTRARAANTALVLTGYFLVMGPWFVRDWQVFGSLLAGAGFKTLFLTTYDDMFAYGRPLTLASYLAWGWGMILKSKVDALLLNVQRLWAENLLIFLLPFTALGLWNLRRERLLWPFLIYLPLLFLTMTLAFTFPGMRGGLYHSGGALLPFFFAAAGPGLEVAVRWAARRLPGWHAGRAWSVFGAGLVVLAIFLTVFVLWQAGVLNGDWNTRDQGYTQIDHWLARQNASQATIMVGDAPAFTWQTGHAAVAVPNEPLDTIVSVADRYGAHYLVLDDTRPRTTDSLYAGQIAHPRLKLQASVEENGQPWQVYELVSK